MKHLNAGEDYRALYINVEIAQTAREDVERGMRAILGQLGSLARDSLHDPFPFDRMKTAIGDFGGDGALEGLLSEWAGRGKKPLVLLIDEIDSLVGDTLVSVLRQLRAGYDKRPGQFPQSVVLCGVRDVQDYRIHSSREKAIITGGSAFNVKAESLRLGDFNREEMEALYREHTSETGQIFTADALDQAWELTRGQPWLVNALAYETCFRIRTGRDRSRSVTAEQMSQARENLIERRETHLDQLAADLPFLAMIIDHTPK